MNGQGPQDTDSGSTVDSSSAAVQTSSRPPVGAAPARRSGTLPWYGFGTGDRYIAAHVIGGTGLALTVLMALFSVGALFDDLGDVGKGSYGIGDAFSQMALELPGLAYALFPLASLIGSLLGLGALSSNSELLVLRASGMSLARQTGTVLKVALVLGVAALAVGDWLAPPAERAGALLRARALQGDSDKGVLLGGGVGVWLRDGRAYVNVRYRKSATLFGDLQIYEFDEQRRLRVATVAQEAEYTSGEWRLREVTQSRIEPDPDAGAGAGVVEQRAGAPTVVSATRLEQARWNSGLQPDLLDPAAARPERLSTAGLRRFVAYLKRNGLDAKQAELAFWSKLTSPLATVAMVFLALPLALGGLRRTGVGQKILVGAAVGVTFHVVNQIAGQSGVVYGLSPLLCALAPTLVFLLLGFLLLRRVA